MDYEPAANERMELTEDEIRVKSIFSGSTKFFIIKSGNQENIETAMYHNVWATTKGSMKKLEHAF